MSLQMRRAVLTLQLLSGNAFTTENQDRTYRMIRDWYIAYKVFEHQDTFLAAVREGRMTIRQAPLTGTYGEWGGIIYGPGFSARRGPEEGIKYESERYRVGIDSMKERLNPKNFGLDGGERLKYKKGLHDLSGSLLTPTIERITKQVRWEWGKLESWITVFMPLAEPEDLALFSLLNAMTKQAKMVAPEIRAYVEQVRKSMTRIKLADSLDIASGLNDISPQGSTAPKFRYGVKNFMDSNGQLTGPDLERAKKALDYRSILPTDGRAKNVNEIVIAYREHAGDRFPIFTRYLKKENAFLCIEGEPSSEKILGKQIPNYWAQTLQL